MSNLKSKIILITGCSSGFGLIMAARLASKGHKVIATMRNLEKNSQLLNELSIRNTSAEIMLLDVTNNNSIKELIDKITEKYGYIDVLINNAGYGIGGFFEDLSEQDIRDIFETNFFGIQNLIRKIIPLMRPHKNGKIINLSSIAGLTAFPCFSAYNATKWALEAFSESIYYELSLFGIDVCLIEPGSYKTKIFTENAKYATNFNNPQSPYFELSQKIKTRNDESLKDNFKDPEDIAILAEKLINSNKPPFRNIPDTGSKIHYLLRKFLPFSIYSKSIKALLK